MLIKACAAAALLLLAACSGDGRSYTPTEPFVPSSPPPPPAPSQNATWSGSWTFDQATPAGDCLADALNAFRNGMSELPFALVFEQDATLVRLQFQFPGSFTQGGFWPAVFIGTVGPDGAVLASVPAAQFDAWRYDPWGELCYGKWSSQGGQLSATLSPDGRRLTGTIVESFVVLEPPQGPTFTIHSHFTAVAP